MCLTHSSLTAQHSLEHSLSGFYPELTHGAGLILISRAYLRRCAGQEVYRERMTALAQAMGAEPSPQGVLDALEKLMTRCGVADLRMSQFGITRESLGAVAEKSVDRRYANERAPLSREEAQAILEQSYA